jgi:hypothetical protein
MNEMDIKYLRLHTFQHFLRGFSATHRTQRMQVLVDEMNIKSGMTVLDLGGQPEIWDSVPAKLNITILNLPGIARAERPSHHNITYVIGDACDVTGLDGQRFDFIFSNSVIEHVGDASKRAAFAEQVKKFKIPYWVQTPSIYFPIEAHNGMPFWWFYPPALRRRIVAGWKKKLPDWTEMVETTDIVMKSELRTLFPSAKIITERVMGFPKSYVVVGK